MFQKRKAQSLKWDSLPTVPQSAWALQGVMKKNNVKTFSRDIWKTIGIDRRFSLNLSEETVEEWVKDQNEDTSLPQQNVHFG